MDKLLTQFLEKAGVQTPEDLDNQPMPDGSPTERETFESYRRGLEVKEVTVDNIKNFCRGQLSVIENKWADLEIDSNKKAELIPYYTVYKGMIAIIESPIKNRESLVNNLKQLTK